MIMQVGLSYKKNDRQRSSILLYSEILEGHGMDCDGWVDASVYLPHMYDIMYLKIEGNQRTVCGWWTGMSWAGLKVKPNDIILYWKRKPEERLDKL